MTRIPLRNRAGEVIAESLVDDDTAARIGDERWCRHHKGYAVRTIDGHMIGLHRYVMGLEHGDRREVDHVNGDKLDNRRCNLRVVTRAQNAQNLGSHPGVSKYRGVSRMRGAWRAQVKADGHVHYLGIFPTELEAARVAAEFRRQRMPFANPARDVLTPIEINERNAA